MILRRLMLAFGVATAIPPALAGTPMTVQLDQSRLVMLKTDPATVIIGNPTIADVTLNGRQMFLHGHGFGDTNIMVFDAEGNKLVDYDISVSHDTANLLTMFVGSVQTAAVRRYSFSCAPICEETAIVGDANLNGVINDSRAKQDFASGVKTSDLQQGGGQAKPAPAN